MGVHGEMVEQLNGDSALGCSSHSHLGVGMIFKSRCRPMDKILSSFKVLLYSSCSCLHTCMY